MVKKAVPGITTTGTAQNPARVPAMPYPSPYTPPPAPAPDPNRPITMGGGTTPYTPPTAPAPDPNRPITTSGAVVPGAGMSNAQAAPGTFNASSNLIGRQFTSAPTQSPGFQGVAGPDYGGVNALLAKAAGQVGAPIGGSVQWDYGADTNKVRGMTMQSLEDVLKGSDRAKLAGDAYGILEERSRPEFDQRVRQLGQNTAALGRVGSGIYGSNLTDLNAEREREMGLNRRELANQAAGQSMQDRLAGLDASRGVGESFAGMDQNRGNIEASRMGAMAQGQGNAFGQNLQLADFMASLSDRKYGADVRERDTSYGAGRDQYGDAVGERGYQYGLDRDAQDDSYRARGFEEDLANSRFNRGSQLYQIAGGKDKNLYNSLLNQSNRYDAQASDAGDAFADSLASYGLRRQGTPAPTRSPTEDFYRQTGAYPEEALNIPTPDYRQTRY
jgi:hypothetical protein